MLGRVLARHACAEMGKGGILDDVASIFDRYEEVRHRLPSAHFRAATVAISSLLDVVENADAFVFDAFGVLNVGEMPIAGAAERLIQLRAAGKAIRILSNATSYNHNFAAAKFQRLGMRVAPDEIVTSRDATLACLGPGLWGCIAAASDDLSDIPAKVCRLEDAPEDYDRVDGILFLSTEAWTSRRQVLLERSLATRPRPVMIANADLVAPREDGFSLEPGHFGHRLEDLGHKDIAYFGKPFPQVYDLTEASLPGVAPDRIVMCGDSLHTDIIGAAARGWRSVLVTRDGLFSGSDALDYCNRAQVIPDWHVAQI